MTTSFCQIVADMDEAYFSEVFAQSPREIRQKLLKHYQLKFNLFAAPKQTDQVISTLQRKLVERQADAECEQILSNYLMKRRALLSAALDHLGIAHQAGLTSSSAINQVAEMDGAPLAALLAACLPVATVQDIALYFRFLGLPGKKLRTLPALAAAPAGLLQ